MLAVGLNCTPPQYATELIRRFRVALPASAVIAYPNSGEIWDADGGRWSGTAFPVDFALAAAEWVAAGARIVGGCCEITPAHIRNLADSLEKDFELVRFSQLARP